MNDDNFLEESEALSFLALCDLRGVGFETLKRVSRERIDFSAFLSSELSSETVQKISVNPSFSKLREHFSTEAARERGFSEARRKLDHLRRRQIEIVFPAHLLFPKKLLDLRDTPSWLFVEGDASVLNMSAITAVGSRKISAEGKWLANYFGFCLDNLKAATVSGLAEGVDQIVHRASIAAGMPTIAVLGTGILSDYPKGSHELRKRIVDGGGTVITEYLPNDTVNARNFVRRNRLQAALGQLVFPIEWGEKSGTAHTVKFAAELARPIVYARTPTQPDFNWIPKNLLSNSGRFTLPAEHDNFFEFLSSKIEEKPAQQLLI